MKTRADLFKKFLRIETRIENPEGSNLPAIRGTLEEKMIAVHRGKGQVGDVKRQKLLKMSLRDFPNG